MVERMRVDKNWQAFVLVRNWERKRSLEVSTIMRYS
jgi:hypothetical protein